MENEKIILKKEQKLDIRVSQLFLDMLEVKTEQSQFTKKSQYVRYVIDKFDTLVECYTMLNSLFVEISDLSDFIVKDFNAFVDLINKHLSIEKLKMVNKELGLE